MTITNALASVAVKDIKAAARLYAKVIGRPADLMPTSALAEWKVPRGGWLQVYALPKRAGSCSCTLAVSSVDAEAARLESLDIDTGEQMSEKIKVFMVKDPDGNSIAFAQSPDATAATDAVSIARAAYDAYVSKDREAIEALIADDFHFTSPLDNRLDRAAYFARCWPNSKTTEGFDFIHLVQSGEQVFVTYEGRGAGGRRFRNTEIVTVRGAQITEVEVYLNLPHKAAVGGFHLDANQQIYHKSTKGLTMNKNTICIWYDKDAEAAAHFYAKTFPDSAVGAVHRAPSDSPGGKKGDVMTVEFTVAGVACLGLNGGSMFKQSEAFSFQIATEDQEETDRYWNAIIGNGGQESQCGWCKDRWGLSWQITPRVLTEALAAGGEEARRAFDAMMGMKKVDVAAIESARKGTS